MVSANDSNENVLLEKRIRRASSAALASLLNLTFLPGIGFIWILLVGRNADKHEIDGYHVSLAIKINVIAAIALLLVSGLMLALGGFDSMYTWAYVLTYFILVHTVFIMAATWALVVAWSGEKVEKLKL